MFLYLWDFVTRAFCRTTGRNIAVKCLRNLNFSLNGVFVSRGSTVFMWRSHLTHPWFAEKSTMPTLSSGDWTGWVHPHPPPQPHPLYFPLDYIKVTLLCALALNIRIWYTVNFKVLNKGFLPRYCDIKHKFKLNRLTCPPFPPALSLIMSLCYCGLPALDQISALNF